MSGILALVAFVLSVLALNRSSKLEKELVQLRAGIAQGGQVVATPVAPVSQVPYATADAPAPAAEASPVQPVVPTAPSEPGVIGKFFQWLAVDWLMKLGAMLLFLGVSWIISVTVWDAIGETGRVLVGILIGAAVLVFGHTRIVRHPSQGAVLEGLGAGILFFTIFVAQEAYQLFPPVVALLFLFLTTVFIGFSSVVRGSQALAVIGIALGGISPLLAGSHETNFQGLFSYIFVLSAGTLWVVRLRGWRPLIFAAFAIYALYSLPFMFLMPDEVGLGEGVIAMLSFATLFFLSNIWAAIKSETMERADMITAAANAMVLIGWINALIPADWKSLVTAACAVAFSLGAVIVFRLRGKIIPVFLYTAVAGMMFGVATAFEFSGAILVIALTLEIGASVSALAAFSGRMADAKGMMLLYIIPVMLSVRNIELYELGHEVFTRDFFALLILGVTMLLSAMIFARLKEGQSSGVATAVGSFYLLMLIWLGLGNVFYQTPDTAVIVSLIIYTLIGLALYIPGKLQQNNGKVYGGVVLLIFVVAHLLLVSVWQMETIGRIITFTLVGILLMSTAFIGKRSGNE